MVTAIGQEDAYRTSVRSDTAEVVSNTIKDGKGATDGFRPHELLEAALAACMNITARMAADAAGVHPQDVTTTVRLKRDGEGPVTFDCELTFSGDASPEQRRRIVDAVAACPVRRTLSRPIRFAFHALDP